MRVVLIKKNVTISREEKDVSPLLKDGWEIVEPKEEKKTSKKAKKEEDK